MVRAQTMQKSATRNKKAELRIRSGHPQITQIAQIESRKRPDSWPPKVALDGGLQYLDGLRTEAVASNILAKTTILQVCSTDLVPNQERPLALVGVHRRLLRSDPFCPLGVLGDSISDSGFCLAARARSVRRF